MAKTVTIKKAEIVSIILTLSEPDDSPNYISSNINYRLLDGSDNVVASPNSQKYTTGANQDAAQTLSADSSTKLQAFWDDMESLMNGKEGL